MSKHSLSLAPLPPPKRLRSLSTKHILSSPQITFETALYDELIIFIFSHLSWTDLCRTQATNRNWSRLATDNQLWKSLYLKEYGRTRLRGARGFIDRTDGREVKRLPSTDRAKLDDINDWKWMFRISSNWRTGRCSVEQLSETESSARLQTTLSASEDSYYPDQFHMLLAGNLTITASSYPSPSPRIRLRSLAGTTHTLFCGSTRQQGAVQITALALDQSPPSSGHLHLASFLCTGEFSIFTLNHRVPSTSSRTLTYVPISRNARTSPIIQAAYHHPLLVTLSQAFSLSIYDLSSDTISHTQTLTSFTSFPPTSLVLSAPSASTYKLVLAYSIPVYPAHWSVGATELMFSGPSSSDSISVIASRSTRALDVPHGWIDQNKLRFMREQWGRKVAGVADTQTDGKWVVLAPGESPSPSPSPPSPSPSTSSSSSCSSSYSTPSSYSLFTASGLHSPACLQLYRLLLPSTSSAQPKLTFVRNLYGSTGPVSALALADGRCVSLGVNGNIWVWDLENGNATGAEVTGMPDLELDVDSDVETAAERKNGHGEVLLDQGKGTIVFDERRILSASPGASGAVVRRFDI